MALLDIFTGEPAIQAGANIQNMINSLLSGVQTGGAGTISGIGNALARGEDLATLSLGAGGTQALDFLRGGRGDITGFLPQAIAALDPTSAMNLLSNFTGQAAGFLGSGTQAATDALSQALGALSGAGGAFGTERSQASQLLRDALGFHGDEGRARAEAAFQTGPGYNFALNQGLESILRQGNTTGNIGGNLLRESQTFGQGLANQEWSNWLNRLFGREQLYAPLEQGTLQSALSGSGALANLLQSGGANLASLFSGLGGNLSNALLGAGRGTSSLLSGAGSSLADLASRMGTTTFQTGGGLADLYSTGGRNVAQALADIFRTTTGATTQGFNPLASSFNTQGMGELFGSSNIWNLLGSLGKFAASPAPTGGFSGSMLGSGLSSLGGLFA